MPRPSSTARRYAEAVVELAERDGTVDAWARDLTFLAALAADARVSRAVDSPAVDFANRRALVERLLAGRVSSQAVNMALRLTRRGRFAILPSIQAEYDGLVRRSRGIVTVSVTTPAPLSKGDLAAIGARAEELAGGAVELTAQTDPSLLGGLTVRIGDRLIDASVRGRLERLRTRLLQGTLTS
jgi:F-type H+-transporting ATPase subunit delta